MAIVICSACGKENDPTTGSWNYCRGCGGRLALPAVVKPVLAEANGSEAVTAIVTRPATAARVPIAQAAPRRSKALSKPTKKKTAKEVQQEMRWWTYGLILGCGFIGMIIGLAMKERGAQYTLITDPFNIGMVGGIFLGGLIAQILIWIKQSQQT